MNTKIYAIIRLTLLVLPAILWKAVTLNAQCTSEAGTLSGGNLSVCENIGFTVQSAGNAVLDADDILLFVAYTGAAPNGTNLLAASPGGGFSYTAAFLNNSPFSVAVVVGNDAGGGQVDWNDPCLSVSPPLTVTCNPNPMVSTTGAVLTCLNPTVTITASTNLPGASFAWTGPNGYTSTVQSPQAPLAGNYCVTVTSQAGCSSTSCVVVTLDANVPIAAAQMPGLLTCTTTSIVLSGAGSSAGPNFVYTWFGAPNILNANTLTPTVNQPGVYTLIVTNAANGCTGTTQVVVMQDIVPPSVNAGPDVDLPCGGTAPVALDGSGSIGPNFTYQWTGPCITTGATTTTPFVACPGVYVLLVTNLNNGCTSTDVVQVTQSATGPQITITGPPALSCSNQTVELTPIITQPPPPASLVITWTGPGITPANAHDPSPEVNGVGAYTLLVVDTVSGCSSSATVVVGGPALTGTTVINALCPDAASGALSVSGFEGGQPPFMYQWADGQGNIIANAANATDLPAGLYRVSITDATNCSFVYALTVAGPAPINIMPFYNQVCDSTTVDLAVSGGTGPFNYAWSGGTGSGTLRVFTEQDLYFVTVTDANGCTQLLGFTVYVLKNCSVLHGRLLLDSLDNCLPDPGETGLPGWIIQAAGPVTFYGTTDADGNYEIAVPAGDYLLSAVLPGGQWQSCDPPMAVNGVQPDDTIDVADIRLQKLVVCPALTVSISTALLRRCFPTNYYHVQYCNLGTGTAADAYVLVTLDPFLSLLAANIPYTHVGGNVYRFEVGDLEPGKCNTFKIQVQVSCNAQLGQTHCTEAHIYPDDPCFPPDPLWSGASLDLRARCSGDSVRFVLKNIGVGPTSEPVEYIVIEDHVMLMQAAGDVLAAGDSIVIAFPANGSTWRVEARQEPYHPGNAQPILSIEGCTTNGSFSTGYLGQFALNEADPFIDIDCTPNIGAFDPNDKQGFPAGYGAAHYVRPGTELEYLIRFQNTGTDTAFNVVIRDTLSVWLDPAGIRPGASSHPYRFELFGPGYLAFYFDNILLPDSNVNEPASHGFVRYTIRHRAGAPLESVIENRAGIYFDFNEPIITNTTVHRLGENFVTVVWTPKRPQLKITAAPNPFREEVRLEVLGLENNRPLRLRVFDGRGRMVQEQESAGPVFTLRRIDWPAGVYWFAVEQDGVLLGSGKLVVRE